MITFSVNQQREDDRDKFILVYPEWLKQYGADKANEIFVQEMFKRGHFGSADMGKRDILNDRFDELQQSRYVNSAVPVDVISSDASARFHPLVPSENEHDNMLDELHAMHLENLIIAEGGIYDEMLVTYGFSLKACFRSPELFNTQVIDGGNITKFKAFCRALASRGIELDDINVSKFTDMTYRLLNEQ